MWKLDQKNGWYQRQRSFRENDDLRGHSITSMLMHPDTTKRQMLVMAKPNILRVYNLITNKVQLDYQGMANCQPG